MNGHPKVVFIANIPSPYRVVFFNELFKHLGNNLTVLYCSKSEPDRLWEINDLNHNHIFLKKLSFPFLSKYKHLNIDVIKRLKELNPDIIITGGFYPTMLLGILFSRLKKTKHYINTDGWQLTEKNYSPIHKFVRHLVYKSTTGFLPVSKKGYDNFISYGIESKRINIIPYVIDNNKFQITKKSNKKYDLLFVGQFIKRKMPEFFFQVCEKLCKKKSLSILMVGDGPQKNQVLNLFENSKLNFTYLGFVQPLDLPNIYASSKIFLFPTLLDGWGVVANEACASGVPTIISENAGASGDLIIHGFNGFILPLDVDIWCNYVIKLLEDENLYNMFSQNCLKHIMNYSPEIVTKKFLQLL